MPSSISIYSIARPSAAGVIAVRSDCGADALDFSYRWLITDDSGAVVASSDQPYRCAATALRDAINRDLEDE